MFKPKAPLVKRSNINYDLNFLVEDDINNEKPTFSKLQRLGITENDKALMYLYLASRKDLPNEMQEYYKKVGLKSLEYDNKKYSHL